MVASKDFLTKIVEAGGRIRVRSALNPILWLCLIVSLPGIVALSLLSQPPAILYWMVGAPIAAAVFGFIFLLIFDRDKLQSEDYQIRKLSLELIEQKGDPGPVLVSNEKLKLIPPLGADEADQ